MTIQEFTAILSGLMDQHLNAGFAINNRQVIDEFRNTLFLWIKSGNWHLIENLIYHLDQALGPRSHTNDYRLITSETIGQVEQRWLTETSRTR